MDPKKEFCRQHGPGASERMAEQGRKGAEAMARKLKGSGLSEFTGLRLLFYTDAFFTWTFVGEVNQPTGELSDAEFLEGLQGYQSVADTYIRNGATIIYN